ncbi:MAG: YchJ family metal-binding protein [Oligoflexia bacterium]|nr:YchJ family metal-binding protein [Oligoflexia bacterium]
MSTTVSPSPVTHAPAPGTCPCCSGLSPESCCLPYIQGKKKPQTAEALLRARYTAFTRADVDYILSTHHSRTRAEVKREEIEEWAKGSRWLGLEIVQQEAGQAADEKGTIVFCARYEAQGEGPGKVEEHWEQSLFEKEAGEWRFLDARGLQQGPYRRAEPKVGRNDPCPCGSGKKYKKCCG